MMMAYRDINTRDLRGGTLADLLINIEADFEVSDDSRLIYSELSFPVAELARELARWVSLGESQASDFYFSSLSFEDPGSVRIIQGPSGWTVGSMFTPEVQSSPAEWTKIAASIGEFVANVKRDVSELGIDPEHIFSY